ncbi:hypothetical protein [Bacteroides nordii]|uniref:hypothetical protein n=1 Tax=Bacteroides nordii TaxID=291645 RepID=UPI00203FBA6A|nr:hypothetical protein [Bacteroides nordii]
MNIERKNMQIVAQQKNIHAIFLHIKPPFTIGKTPVPHRGRLRSSPRNTSLLTGEQLPPHREAIERAKKELFDAFFAYPIQQKGVLTPIIMKEITKEHRTIILLFHS